MSVDASQPLELNGNGSVSTPEDVERLRRLVHAAVEKNAQLEHALESRVVIEQAKGVLRERLGLGTDEAFELLRRAARNHRMPLRDLAARVVAERATPPELVEVLERRGGRA